MKEYFARDSTLTFTYHEFHAFSSLTKQIDTTGVIPLGTAHFDQYCKFCRKINKTLSNIIPPEKMPEEDFGKKVDCKEHFCWFDDNDIVSMTVMDRSPYINDKIFFLESIPWRNIAVWDMLPLCARH